MRLIFDMEKEEAKEKGNRSTEQLNAEMWEVRHIDWTTTASNALSNYQTYRFYVDGNRYIRYERRN